MPLISGTVSLMRDNTPLPPTPIERIVSSIGSTASLIVHTIAFLGFFVLSTVGIISWELMLLVLTTLVSLEAIYLAIFIQITVNRHTQSLREVEEDIDELTEDMDDIQEDLEEISEDIEEIQEDFEEMNEEEEEEDDGKPQKRISQAKALERLRRDVESVLADLEALKQGK
ncbi:DUF1003 domain-containing protein [Patescibacteria group bacterium]|nr:DUF1003 domain-containing protein [Patescibacteria group bacterium]MBU1500886.1 DUF1003 domain-containing protein [Patescibacteria group bacterium]MBU2080941.1 DUF1003 domain-containing protein [Patescibacteria group bacterium]MBU2124046.1 DUF1003 domain-containing protein [Patescibacteria group bacterium]MBU2194663.1 DUF1003 domain-containing protein [Patescibacteria group bacterium]